MNLKVQKDIEKQLLDAIERYHLDDFGLWYFTFGFSCDYPCVSDADLVKIYRHLTEIIKEGEKK